MTFLKKSVTYPIHALKLWSHLPLFRKFYIRNSFKIGAAHAKHAMTVAALTFERILWRSYCFPYSN